MMEVFGVVWIGLVLPQAGFWTFPSGFLRISTVMSGSGGPVGGDSEMSRDHYGSLGLSCSQTRGRQVSPR